MKKQRQAIKSKKSKERRIHHMEIKIMAIICIVVFVVGGLIWVARNKYLLINHINIEIEEPQFVDAKKIKEYATKNITETYFYFLPKNNYFLFSKKTLENQILDNYKQIKNVVITRQGFQTITISVIERKISALWCDGKPPIQSEVEVNLEIGNCYFIDEEGYIFTKTPYFYDHIYFEIYGAPFLGSYKKSVENIFNKATSTSPEKVATTTWGFHPQVNEKASSTENTEKNNTLSTQTEHNYVGTYLLPVSLFTQIMQFMNSLKEVGIASHTLLIHAPNLYELSLTAGGILRFSPEQDLNHAVNNLTTAYQKKFSEESNVVPKDIDYIDIRFENKVVFKFKK